MNKHLILGVDRTSQLPLLPVNMEYLSSCFESPVSGFISVRFLSISQELPRPLQNDRLSHAAGPTARSWSRLKSIMGSICSEHSRKIVHCGSLRQHGNGVVPLPLNTELRKISNGKHWSMASNAKVAHRIGTACSGTGQQLGRKMLKGMMSIVEAYRWDSLGASLQS